MHIDAHCHIYPDEYFEILEKEGPRYGVKLMTNAEGERVVDIKGMMHPPIEPFTNVELRLKTMADMKLDMNILSFSSNPGVYWADDGLAVELCRAANDAYAGIIEKHPAKFHGLASLPAQNVDLSIKELERSVNKLGLKGGFLSTNVNGRYLDDERFYPLYEAAAGMDVPIIVHPANPAGKDQMNEYHLFNLVGFPTESANCIGRLIFSGLFDRLPNLTFIFLHGGGTVPYLIGRFGHGWKVRPECEKISRSPLEYLRSNFYLDMLVFHPPVVRFLVDTMGSERVVLGTDLPYDMTDTEAVETLRQSGLSQEEYENVSHKNIQSLLNL